jgi:hypothetical protein
MRIFTGIVVQLISTVGVLFLFGFLIAFGITETVKKLYVHHDETLAKLFDVLDIVQEKAVSYMKKAKSRKSVQTVVS